MLSELYSTAENASGSLRWYLQIRRLEAARSALGIAGGLAIEALILIAIGKVFGILIANTDSAAPAGIYRVAGHEVRRGELVAACLPMAVAQEGLARGYLRTGGCPGGAEPVGKIAAALPGDVVELEPGSVSINGRRFAHSATVAGDSHGRPLAHVAWGRRVVADNEVWLFGFNDRRSWDARYFGPVPLTSVKGELEPVLTW